VPTAELPPDELLCANAPVQVKAITVARASVESFIADPSSC
jgi:hypothetical protein